MGVEIPRFRLQSTPDLPEMRRRLKGMGQRKEIVNDITLTSMIDIFSVIVLFLIQSFAATGEVFIINPAISLPQANHGVALTRSPIVTILPTKVTVEGLDVGSNKNLSEKIEETDWDLPQLTARLQSYRDFVKSIYPEAPFPGEVIIQADANLDFIYLKRVLYTLTKIGFSNINLAVRGEASKAIGNALQPTSKMFKQTRKTVDKITNGASESAEKVFDDISNEIQGEEGTKGDSDK